MRSTYSPRRRPPDSVRHPVHHGRHRRAFTRVGDVLRTTNALEREHVEARRRARVIRIFPNEASYFCLVSALTIDRNDAWAKRRYVIPAPPLATTIP